LQFSVHVWNNKQWNNKQPSPCNHNFWQSSIPQGVVNRRNNWSRYSYGSQYFHSITANLRTLLQHQQHPLGPGRNTSYLDFMGDMMIVKLRGEIICQGISEHRWHPNIALTQPHYGFRKWLSWTQPTDSWSRGIWSIWFKGIGYRSCPFPLII
jgi:hypothetical protein